MIQKYSLLRRYLNANDNYANYIVVILFFPLENNTCAITDDTAQQNTPYKIRISIIIIIFSYCNACVRVLLLNSNQLSVYLLKFRMYNDLVLERSATHTALVYVMYVKP